MRTVNSFVGQPTNGWKTSASCAAAGQYVDDLARKDMLHAAILRSSVGHGPIRSIDVSPREKSPRRACVITAARSWRSDAARADAATADAGIRRVRPAGMARDKVRYVGEALGWCSPTAPASPRTR